MVMRHLSARLSYGAKSDKKRRADADKLFQRKQNKKSDHRRTLRDER